jgi:hypothetical protein
VVSVASEADRLAALQEADMLLCSVVKAGLWHGAEKYSNREARLAKLTEIFARYVSCRSMTPPRVITPRSGMSWKRARK